MRLAAKIILLFLCGLFLIVGVFAIATIYREKQATIEQHQRYATELANILKQRRQQDQFDRGEALPKSPPAQSTQLIQIRRVERLSAELGRQPHVPHEHIFYSQQVTTFTSTDPEGNDRLYTYVPLGSEENEDGTAISDERLEVSAPDIDGEKRVWRTVSSTMLTLLSVAGLSAMVVYFGGVRMVGRPLEKLIDRVNRIADGDLSARIQINSRDELSDLAVAINAMCDRLKSQREEIESESKARIAAVEQLRHADRLKSVGRIAAGLAHEIGTPLNVVAGHAELIEGGELSESAVHESCRQIRNQCHRISQTITSLLAFARNESSRREVTDIRRVVNDTCQLLRPIARKASSTLEAELPDEALVADVDSSQLQQVLTNLISNALQSSENP